MPARSICTRSPLNLFSQRTPSPVNNSTNNKDCEKQEGRRFQGRLKKQKNKFNVFCMWKVFWRFALFSVFVCLSMHVANSVRSSCIQRVCGLYPAEVLVLFSSVNALGRFIWLLNYSQGRPAASEIDICRGKTTSLDKITVYKQNTRNMNKRNKKWQLVLYRSGVLFKFTVYLCIDGFIGHTRMARSKILICVFYNIIFYLIYIIINL